MLLQDLVGWIIDRFEGSIFTEDPVDTGGATKYGITLRTLQYYRQKMSDKRDLVVTVEDVKALTRGEAIDCITEVFVMESGIALIDSQVVRFALIDYAIHSGWVPAIRALQVALGTYADGVIGPITIAKAKRHLYPSELAACIVARRQNLMLALIDKRPSQKKWEHGWIRRTTRVLNIVLGLERFE